MIKVSPCFIVLILFIIFIYNYDKNVNKEEFSEKNAVDYLIENKEIDKKKYFIPDSYYDPVNVIKHLYQTNYNIKLFIIPECDEIVSKMRIHKYINQKYPNDNLIPNTYTLGRDNDLIKKVFNRNKIYILKKNIQRQEGLELTNNLDRILNAKEDDFVVVQEFLQNPYLINGRKINIRVYMLMSCDNGKLNVWIYKNGFMYYTPKLFRKYSLDIGETITTGYIDRKVYDENPLTTEDFRKYIGKENAKLYDSRLSVLMYKVINSLSDKFCINKNIKNYYQFQLFGVDIAPDENLNVQLIEVNKGPDLTFKDERDGELKIKMVREAFNLVNKKNIKNDFIQVY